MFFGGRSVLLMTVAVLRIFPAVASSDNNIKIDVVWHGKSTLLEGPHYVPGKDILYWVDILEQKVYRKDFKTGLVEIHHVAGGPVSLVIPVAGESNELVLGVGVEIQTFSWDTGLTTYLGSVDEVNNRFNDGKADARGRLWLGTISKEPKMANFYMATVDNLPDPELVEAGVTTSNGLTWNKDNTLMYYIDSDVQRVDVFDFDLEAGSISNRRAFFDLAANGIEGYPDGMTIDTDENLWVAVYNGSRIIKISPAGELLDQIMIPATEITSLAWGGTNLDILYVTSARQEALHQNEELAGSVFSIKGTGARGRPAFEARITEN